MDALSILMRLSCLAALTVACSGMSPAARAAQVTFDLPSSVECRDVTSREFAQFNPTLKVIEAKFRISARMIEGTPADVVEFFYTLKTDQTMRITDYFPNTTLESKVDADHIEVTDATEAGKADGVDAHVVFKPFALGGSHNQTVKKSESSHYKQIAAKDLVLSSGTTDREHGVFYRLQPSRSDSLEGGKEFKFLATVPRNWRGDLCTISCAAKATKRSMISTSCVEAGSNQVQVGMYLAGNLEAASLAEDLRNAQERQAELLAKNKSNGNVFHTISTQTVGRFTGEAAQRRQALEDAQKNLAEVRQRIAQLAR
jgi:hypothetical protein